MDSLVILLVRLILLEKLLTDHSMILLPGSPLNQSLQLESRPRTHPPNDTLISSANGHRHHKSKRSTDNQQRKNR